MKDISTFLEDIMKLGARGLVSCLYLQFALCHKALPTKKRKSAIVTGKLSARPVGELECQAATGD